MIKTLHFAESEKDLPKDWKLTMPDLVEGAKRYADFLMDDDQKRIDWESSHKNLYYRRYYPIVEDIHTTEHINVIKNGFESSISKKHQLICLERLLGEEMFREMKWNTPEVQTAYTKSKVAGADFYNQFESNPDGAADYLDNLKDRSDYNSESEKIERGVKYGKHENH